MSIETESTVAEPRREPIPFHRPSLGEDDLQRVVETLRSGWLSTGPVTRQLEEALAGYLGRAHVVAVSSATAALQLLYKAAGVGPGDEVITTPLTFVSTAEVAVHLGARPVFVDVQEHTGNLDPRHLERAITPKTKCIVPVHFGGQLCDMWRIREIADRAGIAVVEDAAHALSSHAQGRRPGAGTLGAALSFYATKELALGEGGAVACDSAQLAEKVRRWSLHGMTRSGWTRSRGGRPPTYDVEDLGYKMNLPDVLAALGLGQVPKLERFRARRERFARIYDEELAGLDGVRPMTVRDGSVSSRHLYVVRIDSRRAGIDRDEVIAELGRQGIQTSVHFVPLHTMTVFRRDYGTRAQDCPVAHRLGQQMLSLPLYPDLGEDRARDVARRLRGVVEGRVGR